MKVRCVGVMVKLLPSRNIRHRSIAGNDYTALKRKPSNRWTPNQRVVLALLTSFKNDWKDITKIFNALFRDELPRKDGLSEDALRAMSYCVELRPAEVDALALLQAPSISTDGISFEAMARSWIERTAEALGIVLMHRNLGTPPRATKKIKAMSMIDITPQANLWSNEDDDGIQRSAKRKLDTMLGTLAKDHTHEPSEFYPTPSNSSTRSLKAPNLTPPSPAHLEAEKSYQVPRPKLLPSLGFRAFNECSMGLNHANGFVAGQFVNSRSIPEAPHPRSASFLEEANLRKSYSLLIFSFKKHLKLIP